MRFQPQRLRTASARLVAAAICLLGLSGCIARVSDEVEIEIVSWEIESVSAENGAFLVHYRARCASRAGEVLGSAALLLSAGDAEILDGLAQCGGIAAGEERDASDTISLLQAEADPLDPSALPFAFVQIGAGDRLPSQTLTPTITQHNFSVGLSNGAGEPLVLSAMAMSTVSETQIVAGLVVGETPAGSALSQAGLLSVQQPGGVPFDPATVHWSLRSAVAADLAVGVTRTLDGVGHPLGEVRVEEDGPEGSAERITEPNTGFVSLAQQAGAFRWRFSKEGHLPVWRSRTLEAGEVASIHAPWLTKRDGTVYPVTVLNGGEVGDPEAWTLVEFAPGSVVANTTAVLTELSGQSLPSALPPGWSPLNAFWLELAAEPATPGTGQLRARDEIASGEDAAFVRFDPATSSWVVLELVPGSGAAEATVSVPGSGAYALVVADVFPAPPPEPAPGAALAASPTAWPEPGALSGTGSASPGVRAASLDPAAVTVEGRVVVEHEAPLASGLLLRGEVDEHYRFFDGSERSTPRYASFFVGYQRPGDGDPRTLEAIFPLRPTQLFGPRDLAEANLEVEILPVSAFSGAVLGNNGGTVISSQVAAVVPAGVLSGDTPVELRDLDPTAFGDEAVAAFDLAVGGVLSGERFDWLLGRREPGAHYVLSAAVSGFGLAGLEPRERYVADATGLLLRAEPATGGLPGIRGPGRFVLVRVDGPQGLVEGTARDTLGVARAGLAVRVEGAPWLTFSDADGSYQLVAGVGSRELAASDPGNGDRGVAPFAIVDGTTVASVDVATVASGPTVIALEPEDGADRASPATPVVVTLSEAVDPESFGPNGLVLLDAEGEPVVGALSLSLAGTELTFLPNDPLAPATAFTVVLDPNLADLQGLLLEGPTEFGFTTVGAAARGVGAELVSWEPGSETSPCVPEPGGGSTVPGFDPDDPFIACVQGGPGTADPDVPVILVNETTGSTATVLSNLDGSFLSFVDADVDDFIAANFVNANGTRIRIPLSRQNFDDGSVGLFEGGGILEASNEEEGTARVFIEPGAIQTKNKFKMDVLGAAELLLAIQNTPPEDGQLLGGFRFEVEGDELEGEAEITYPADPDELGITEEEAMDGAFALALVREIDGETAYQVVDKMRYEDGEVSTNTFPFLGMLATVAGAYGDADDLFSLIVVPMFLGNSAVVVQGTVYRCPQASDGGCAGANVPGLGPVNIQALLAKPLPGAYVVLDRPGTLGVRRGRVRGGVAYATSDQKGNYALVAPTGLAGFVLRATHPRYARVAAAPVFGLLDFGLTGTINKNLFIVGESNIVSSPPRMNVAHEPYYPQPGQTANLVVSASQPAGAPDISASLLEVESLVPGVDVTADDVAIEEVEEEILSPTRRRKTFELSSDKAVYAVLRIRSWSTTAAGPPVEIRHGIAFAGGPNPGSDPLEPTDPADTVSPVVSATFPTEGAIGVAAGEPLRILFNEPVSNAVLSQPGAVTLDGPTTSTVGLSLSQDQQTLFVTPGPLSSGGDYTLHVSPGVLDLNGNPLDQDPAEDGAQGFTLNFQAVTLPSFSMTEVGNGGGVELHRNWAYVIDREGEGAFHVYDVSNPATPALLSTVGLPGFPRDLLLIPEYSYALKQGGTPQTGPLLIVSGGNLGSQTIDEEGNVFLPGQYLRIYDVSDPSNPVRLVSPRITQRPSVVTQLEWHPPNLVYFENGSDLQQIGVINLQKFLIGFSATEAEIDAFGLFPFAGVDANFDGDYVDDGETLPRPGRDPVEFFGKEFACTLIDTRQRILDYHFGPGFCGVTLRAGSEPDEPPAYRTVIANGFEIEGDEGTYAFEAGANPKRLEVLFDARVETEAGTSSRILALVSLAPDADGETKLAVLDVTIPGDPQPLAPIVLPADLGLGLPQSVFQREDGLLALATTRDLVLIDPTRFGETPPDGGLHPAVVGVVPGAGSGNLSLASRANGLNLVSLGGRNDIVVTPPRMRFLTFPGAEAVPDVTELLEDEEKIGELFEDVFFTDALLPARLTGDGGATPSLSPPSPRVHYQVLVEAPGGIGENIPVTLEALNRSGRPLKNLGRSFPPVRAASPEALEQIEQEARAGCDAPIGALQARRLTSDKTSPYYDYFLTEPFALTYERVSAADLTALEAELPRRILWSGAFMRASIDPAFANDGVLGPFAARVHEGEKVLRPGVAVTAKAFPGAYVVGPNPPPVGGQATVPGTFGNVSGHNAEFRHETIDIALPGRRMPIVFERAIGGQDLYEGPFGRGWDFNLDERLEPLESDVFPPGQMLPIVARGDDPDTASPDDTTAASGDVIWHTGGGRVILFRRQGEDGADPPSEIAQDPLVQELGWHESARAFYLPESGVYDVLVRFPSGEFARLSPEGEQYFYAANGRLQRRKGIHPENEHVFTHNARGELVRVTDRSADERFIEVAYHRFPQDPLFDSDLDVETSEPFVAGKIARIRDYAGRDVLFHYNDDGLLERREGFELQGLNQGFEGRPSTHYLSDEECSGVIQGVVAGASQSGGGTPIFAGTLENQETQPEVTGGTSASGSVEITLAGENDASQVENGQMSLIAADGTIVTLTFDENGRAVETTTEKGDTSETTGTAYGDDGRLDVLTNPEGDRIEFTYDRDNPVFRARGNLLRTEWIPGARGGEPYSEEFPDYDLRYNLPVGAHQDRNGNEIVITLTPDGREIDSQSLPGVGEESWTYNEYGQVLSHSTGTGLVFSKQYDDTTGFVQIHRRGTLETTLSYDSSVAGKLGKPTGIQYASADASPMQLSYDARLAPVSMTRGNQAEQRAYDENGNLVRRRLDLGDGQIFDEERTYDLRGFLESIKLASVEVDGSAVELETTFTPNESGLIDTIQHPGGETTSFTYDAEGRVLTMTTGDQTRRFVRDLVGNATEIHLNGVLVEELVYNGHDELIERRRHTGDGPVLVERSYYPNGELKTEIVSDPAFGVVQDLTVGTIDALGRPRQITIAGDQTAAEVSVNFAAGGSGYVQTTSGPRDTVSTTVDAAGRVRMRMDSIGTVTYDLDGNDNLRSTTTNDGLLPAYVVTHGVDGLDHATDLSDGEGRLAKMTSRTDGAEIEQIDNLDRVTLTPRTVLGELRSFTRPNGVGFEFLHTAHRKLKAVLDTSGLGRTFEYDDSFRLSGVTYRDGSAAVFSGFDHQNLPQEITIPGGSHTLGYDDLGRLKTLSAEYGSAGPYMAEFSYDGLDRVRVARFGADGSDELTTDYDRIGSPSLATWTLAGASYPIAYGLYEDGSTQYIDYPSGPRLDTVRDAAGRLTTLGADTLIRDVTTWASASMPERVEHGSEIVQHDLHDARRRLVARRYERASDGALLAEWRYAYDPVDQPLAQQHVHDGGRVDVFAFDEGPRLTAAHLGARPVSDADAGANWAPSPFPGFTAGRYQRDYGYDSGGLDLMESIVTDAPADADLPPSAGSFTAFDGFLFPRVVDGVGRGAPDPLGAAAETRLATRPEGASAPVLADAALEYDGTGQLVRVVLPNDRTLEYDHDPDGLIVRKRTFDDTELVSERVLIWDRGRLIEEYEIAGDDPGLRGRYYYGAEDSPVAADLGPDLVRHHYLKDRLGNVAAVADSTGNVVERVRYDPFGQPTVEGTDSAAPRVQQVVATGGGFVLVFSEAIVPPLGPGDFTAEIATNVLDISDRASLTAGNPVSGDLEYLDVAPGLPSHRLLRFAPGTTAPAASYVLELDAGTVVDGWGNPNPAESIAFNWDGVTMGPILTTGVGSTAPPRLARSALGSPFLFHGQYFDYDAGLVYLRARFYDPYTAQFLQRDPEGYVDSVNLYAAFKHNPVHYRDPLGTASKHPFAKGGAQKYHLHNPGTRARGPGRTYSVTDDYMEHGIEAEREAFRRAGLQMMDNVPSSKSIDEVANVGRYSLGRQAPERVAIPAGPRRALPEGRHGSAPEAPVSAKATGYEAHMASRKARAQEMFPELAGVNPTQCKENCMRASNALESRLAKGSDAVAPSGVGQWAEVREMLPGERWARFDTASEVVERVKKAGDGAVFQLGARFKPGEAPTGFAGHQMTVVNRRGVVYFLDGQQESFGTVARWSQFNDFVLLRRR